MIGQDSWQVLDCTVSFQPCVALFCFLLGSLGSCFDRVVVNIIQYMFFMFSVSIRRIVFLRRFCTYTVYERNVKVQLYIQKCFWILYCSCCVIFLYISSKNGRSVKWQKECSSARSNPPHKIALVSAIIESYFKLQMLTKRSLPRNYEIQWSWYNESIYNYSKQTYVKSMC